MNDGFYLVDLSEWDIGKFDQYYVPDHIKRLSLRYVSHITWKLVVLGCSLSREIRFRFLVDFFFLNRYFFLFFFPFQSSSPPSISCPSNEVIV